MLSFTTKSSNYYVELTQMLKTQFRGKHNLKLANISKLLLQQFFKTRARKQFQRLPEIVSRILTVLSVLKPSMHRPKMKKKTIQLIQNYRNFA